VYTGGYEGTVELPVERNCRRKRRAGKGEPKNDGRKRGKGEFAIRSKGDWRRKDGSSGH